jgi:hypothetical protein
MSRSTNTLQLREEISSDKKELRETQIGRLYIKQLKRWIDEAKDERKVVKRAKGNTDALNEEIKVSKQHLVVLKGIKYPNIKSRRENEKANRIGYQM